MMMVMMMDNTISLTFKLEVSNWIRFIRRAFCVNKLASLCVYLFMHSELFLYEIVFKFPLHAASVQISGAILLLLLLLLAN